MIDESTADYNVEAQNTSFGSYGSQCPIMGSPEQRRIQDDSQVFVVGDEENEVAGTSVRTTVHNEAALSRSPIQISRSPIQLLQTPARPERGSTHQIGRAHV